MNPISIDPNLMERVLYPLSTSVREDARTVARLIAGAYLFTIRGDKGLIFVSSPATDKLSKSINPNLAVGITKFCHS